MSRIFITGASGFIGLRLLKQLVDDKYELLLSAKDNDDQEILSEYSSNILIGNFNEIESLKYKIINFNPDICVYLAWEGIPDYSYAMSKRNIDNSISLINVVLDETSCKRLIISGSCYEYGITNGECNEQQPTKTTSCFSWAKHALHNYCIYKCGLTDVELYWFRLFYVYGPGQRPGSIIPTLVRNYKENKMPDIKTPYNANDYIFVDDVVRAFYEAINAFFIPGLYNLGSGKATTVMELCNKVESLIFNKPIISQRIHEMVESKQVINFWADTSKICNVLPWFPKITLDEGIDEYIQQEGIL